MFKKLEKIASATYLVPKERGMLVPGLIIATEEMLKQEEIEQPLEQVRNVAYLPGIVGYSIAMPDMHWGYGFPIGGVAAVDATDGVISPGGVGYDINCGVRLALVPLMFNEMNANTKHQLLKKIYSYVPSGVGKGHKMKHDLSETDYAKIASQGARWSIEQGYGYEDDLDHIESYGLIEGANIKAVSRDALERGRDQLGSIGSGNHFVEIGVVETLFLPEIAEAWGVQKGQTYVMIHSGSRGFGHQICQDTLNKFIKMGLDQNLPDRQLVAAPIISHEGKEYFQAMATAANFAFNNRQQILHHIREAFLETTGVQMKEIRLLYDVCHNIAKFETHEINGKPKPLCVHRKGATRAFGKGAKELPPLFQATGQPVMVPGDMGRASYLMVGLGNALTWCSACHGAGRARSRHQSAALWRGRDPYEYMKSIGVEVMASSMRTVTEEMPDAYKNVNEVVKAVEEAGLANIVARLKPHMVIKG